MGAHNFLRRAAFVAVALVAGIAARPTAANAQQFDVRGLVVDSARTPISGAMVVALTRTDSVIAAFATSGGSGGFILRRLTPGDYILQVTRIGSKPYRRNFTLGAANFAADTVVMMGAGPVKLDDLVVSAEHVPIVNKPDTLEFNADAFKTRLNATVEELLKRLPGVTVASDGTITAQGKTVQQVLVDGKEFFGNDPKMATRNLPAAAIDKVQVLEQKSDAAQFTGIDDGQERTTVNLVLKPNARVGYFGRAVGGAGPSPNIDAGFAGTKGDDARYTSSLNLNRFSPETQLSFVGSRNNVGASGFSFGPDIMMGGGRGGGGAGSLGSGFSETMALGLNGSRQFAKNSWLRGSYFLSTSDNRQQAVTDEQLLQGASVSAYRTETATTAADNLSHRLNLNAQHAFNDWNQLRFRGNFNAGTNTSDNISQQQTLRPDGTLQNRARSTVATDGDNLNGDGRFTFSRRFNQAGRSLVAEAWGELSSPDQLTNLSSSTDLSDGLGGITTRDILQSQHRDSRTFTTGQRLALTEPLGGGSVLELFGQHRAISEDQTYDVNDLVNGTPVPNTDLSRAFERTYRYVQGGTRFSRNSPTLRWVLGLEVQSSDLQGTILGRNESIDNGFTNLLPSANLRYQFNQGSNVTLNYRTSTRDPSLNELQPFVDNTDPLRIYAGNPNLTPQYQHSVRADFRRFDQFTFRNYYLYANVGYNRNQIVQSRNVDAQGRQTVMPVNLGDGWNSNLGGSVGTPIRSLGAQVDLDYNYSRSLGQELVNSVENESRTTAHNIGIRVQNRAKEIFDLNAGAQWGFNDVSYSINSALNQSYLNSSYYGDATWFVSTALSANASGNYQVFDQNLFGPRDNIFMLGASVGMQMFNNRGEIRVSGVDLLNENNGISISSSSSFIRQRQSPTLGRRVMVSFSYQLGSNLAPAGGGRRRG
ncbi:MAG TPA: outer membrane beta-barrel family protein [Gemmatimonadales bacterium]|nr:outer membrane beta-barrel family protein [Gemmatimonadales bacterium]